MLRQRYCFCVLCMALGLLVLLSLLGLAPERAAAQAPGRAKGPISFINDVAPILKENCFACHDTKKRKGKLEMTSFETLHKGGSSGEPWVAGKPEESLVIELLTTRGKSRMPPKEAGEALPKEKVEIIRRWIKE